MIARPLVLTLIAALAAPAAPAWAQGPSLDPARRYSACMAQARAEPVKALNAAQEWLKDGGGMAARHCIAIALYGAGQFVEAGAQLEQLGREMTGQSAQLRAEAFAQAGQAYQAARLGEKALSMQNAAILLDPRNADIWVDRSITFAAVSAWREAASDLSRALQLSPDRPDVLVLRAAAWRNAGDSAKALADAEAALKLEKDYPDALLERGLARRLRNDRAGSDADLKRVIALAGEDSDLGRRAKDAMRGAALAKQPAPPPRRPTQPAKK
ncbi:MAG: tetratricopeptide repeat protein [Alphaproteobacteria bacterium]|nr:tetratricopeptide repeat protein [Alphaproteobacteria bacterium]MCW5740718.1 tetratricopeptide repeat protein [Alphaproteobacteria bacterium]